MTQRLKVIILGSGCSTGVPRVDGYWGACNPDNPKNRRSRCSAWFGVYEDTSPDRLTSVVIDTAPEFREQVLRAGITQLDAVLWTHDHADQSHGIDDIRAMTFATGSPIDGYMDTATHAALTRRFAYVFQGNHGYPPTCRDHIIPPHGMPWKVNGAGGVLPVLTFAQRHGPVDSVGYRLGDAAYSSDVSDLPEKSFEALTGLKLWIVDCLRYKPHPTHAHLDLALSWIDRVKPERAILTNLHQDLDYDELKSRLPAHIEPAWDQMTFDVAL